MAYPRPVNFRGFCAIIRVSAMADEAQAGPVTRPRPLTISLQQESPGPMADPIIIKLLTGAVAGFDEPTFCHSGKPKRTRCYAVSHEPGRDGWVLVKNPSFQRRRDGWWCPDCAHQLREELAKQGGTVISENIPISAPGTA